MIKYLVKEDPFLFLKKAFYNNQNFGREITHTAAQRKTNQVGYQVCVHCTFVPVRFVEELLYIEKNEEKLKKGINT